MGYFLFRLVLDHFLCWGILSICRKYTLGKYSRNGLECTVSYDIHIYISPLQLCLGDIVYLHLPAQPTIVLNTVKSATDLLERRSGIYSSRPYSVMVDL